MRRVALSVVAAACCLFVTGAIAATAGTAGTAATAATAAGAAAATAAAGAPDYTALGRIRDEGLHRSQVMEIVEHLTDEIGPRLTGSPQMKAANDWTVGKLKEWGLSNPHLEPWEFGEGWSFSRAEVRMLTPSPAVLLALPKAWTPGTGGPVTGKAMYVVIEKIEDLDPFRGDLAGKILLISKTPDAKDPARSLFERYDSAKLDDLAAFDIPPEKDANDYRERGRKRRELWAKLAPALVEEGVLATVEVSPFDNGLLTVMGGAGQGLPDQPPGVPSLVMAVEPYERILRLLDRNVEVSLTVDIEAQFYRDSPTSWNTVAEIPGSDKNAEVVMAGAHLDSWHTGTGATDNAAGSAVVLEAARILKTLGLQPKRTIRVALWSGEEQGLLGSRAYVAQHFATRPDATDKDELALPARWRKPTWPIEPKPEHARLAAYFNLDNGGGRVHGIYAQENLGAKMLFEKFMEPLKDLGVTTVTMENTGSTDHVSFDAVGLPGFQFIQDARDYSTRTHHSNIDTYDHLNREDMMQAAVVMATFLYEAATLDGPFPRKPMPVEPPAKAEKKMEKKMEKPSAGEPKDGSAAAVQPPKP
ncbi:MAG: M20/M25/M40 family metallo-hydrolase [Thermoanaerobaculia bacterium]